MIEGKDLRTFFDANERLELKEVVRIMGELLSGLDFAHEAGVIHRDVKPANVMLDAQRRVKLADFGVARVQEAEHSTVGTMVGTPAFMSPEQIQGGKIDRRTDIFSAGTILFVENEKSSKKSIFNKPINAELFSKPVVHRMYLLTEGAVELTAGGKLIDVVRAGEVFGEMAVISEIPGILTPSTRSATATAKADCTGYSLDGTETEAGLNRTPEFALMYPNDSLGARLQSALPETHVVKSLNTLPGTLAVAPGNVQEPSSVFLSGDDADAKALVSGLLVDLGWPTEQQVDLGGIDSARGPEHYFVLFVAMMQAFRGQAFNIRVVR